MTTITRRVFASISLLVLTVRRALGAQTTPQVDSGNDDATERDDDVNFRTSDTISVRSGPNDYNRWHAGFIFTVTGPASGDTIDSAYLIVYFNDSFGRETYVDAEMDIYCEDVDDADDFAATADLVNRTLTTASTAWVADDVVAAEFDEATSPDISGPVGEVIARGSWASGNDLTVICWGQTVGTSKALGVYAYDENSTYAAKLEINYTPAAGGVRRRMVVVAKR